MYEHFSSIYFVHVNDHVQRTKGKEHNIYLVIANAFQSTPHFRKIVVEVVSKNCLCQSWSINKLPMDGSSKDQ